MKVLMVEPGTEPYEKELNGLKEMQQAVGGLIQAIYPFEDKVAVVATAGCSGRSLCAGWGWTTSFR